MLRKLLIIGLALIMIVAVGASFYNVYASRDAQSKLSAIDLETQELSTEQKILTAIGDLTSSAGSATVEGAPWDLSTEQTNPNYPVTSDSQLPSQDAYNQSSGQGNRFGRGGGRGNGSTEQNSYTEPAPQNGFQEWLTVQGFISDYTHPDLTLITSDGNSFVVQMSNQSYLERIGFNILPGDVVTITGFYDLDGGFTVGQITLSTTGQTYTLRDESGRPMWAGGPNRG